MGIGIAAISSVINEWKRGLGSAVADAYRRLDSDTIIGLGVGSTEIIQVFKLIHALRKFGVEAQAAEEFISKFEKAVILAGVTPEGLANIMNYSLKMAEMEGIDISQIPAQIDNLSSLKQQLEQEIKTLTEKKVSIARDLSVVSSQRPENVEHQLGGSVATDELSEFSALKKGLAEYHLSLDDLAAFRKMIDNARKHGYDLSNIIDLVSSVGSLELEKNDLDAKLGMLRESETSLRERQMSIEEELGKHHQTLNLIEGLKEYAINVDELKLIFDQIQRIGLEQAIDFNAAKEKFFNDIGNRPYPENRELTRGNAAVDAKISPQNGGASQEFLEMVDRLTSKGITEQALMKSLIISDIFKLDLDSFSNDLRNYKNLSNAIKRLGETRVELESEELLLKHKLVALEQQHQLLVSAVNKVLEKSSSRSKELSSELPGTYVKNDELEPLLKAISGVKVDSDEFKISLEKAIEAICIVLGERSLTRKILEHAKLALEHEQKTAYNNNS